MFRAISQRPRALLVAASLASLMVTTTACMPRGVPHPTRHGGGKEDSTYQESQFKGPNLLDHQGFQYVNAPTDGKIRILDDKTSSAGRRVTVEFECLEGDVKTYVVSGTMQATFNGAQATLAMPPQILNPFTGRWYEGCLMTVAVPGSFGHLSHKTMNGGYNAPPTFMMEVGTLTFDYR